MPTHRPSSGSDNSEEERAFLQTRVALFWKVIFLIVLLGCVLGAFGAVVKPGADLLLTLASATQAGIFWWLCRRGVRSIRFSRAMESGGLLLNSIAARLAVETGRAVTVTSLWTQSRRSARALHVRRVCARSFGGGRAGSRAG